MPVDLLHLSRTHHPLHQLTAMEFRNLLIVVIVGILLAMPDISSCQPASRHLPQGRATSSTTSAPTKTAIRHYKAFPKPLSKSHQNEVEEVVTCKVIMWKLFCMVKFIQATRSTPTTTEATIPRTTTASPLRKLYNKSRIIFG